MIIEPTAVTGREDQTVKELLAESGHEFAGLEDGWIVSIDGVTGNYRRFFDGNAYQLDTKLKDVTVLCFTEAEDAYSENMLELIRYLNRCAICLCLIPISICHGNLQTSNGLTAFCRGKYYRIFWSV